MFDIGFSELLVIGVVALIVIGPERLPRVARTAGHLFGRFQRYVSGVKADIAREMELDELRKFKNEFEDSARSIGSSLHNDISLAQHEITALKDEVSHVMDEAKKTHATIPDVIDSSSQESGSSQLELPLAKSIPKKHNE